VKDKIKARSVPFSQTRTRHASETAEDYVEAVMELIEEKGECRVLDLARYFMYKELPIKAVDVLNDGISLQKVKKTRKNYNQCNNERSRRECIQQHGFRPYFTFRGI